MKPTPYTPLGLRRPILAVMFSLLAFVFQTVTASATNYYFSQAGNNNWDGESPQTPMKDLSIALGLAVPGNAILFRRGDTWADPSYAFNLQNQLGSPGHEIYIGAYNEPDAPTQGPDPIISTLHRESSANWGRVGSTNTWQKEVTYSDAWRVYVNGSSKAKILTTNPNDVNQPHEWYIKPAVGSQSAVLYVNTSPAGNAPQNVEVQLMGSQPALKMTNCNYVTVQNLDFRGGSQRNVIEVHAPCVNLTIDHCVVKQGRWNGILVTNLGATTSAYVNGITISNCTVDRTWTSEEDNVFFGGGDGIVLQHAVRNGVIFKNVVQNWPHTGIEVAAYRGGFHGVHNIVVEENKVTAGKSGYMHPFSVYGFEDGATDITVRRNFFYDYTSTSHAMGNDNKYYSNIFARARRSTLAGHQNPPQPYGIDMAPWIAFKVVPTDPTVWMVAHDNIVANNTFYDIDEFPIYLYENPNGPAVYQNLFYNNLMVKYGDGVTSPDVGLKIQPTVQGNIYARNNNFWDVPGSVPVAQYKTSTYTAAGLTNITSTPGEFCSDNRQVETILQDPANNVFSLRSDASLQLKEGGMVLSGLLGADFKDYEGKAWHISKPSIGAIQVPF